MPNVVDRLGGASSSLAFKAPCRVATTANITLSGFQSIDGVLPTSSEHVDLRRVLVKNQTNAKENGIYCVDLTTEALTKRGFKNASELTTDDFLLTLNIETGKSEWQRVEEVCRFPVQDVEMLDLKTQGHSSLSTLNHRWPVLTEDGLIRIWHSSDIAAGRTPHTVEMRQEECVRRADGTFARWKSSRQSFDHASLLKAAECATLPAAQTYDDAFVELVAWFVTEGHIRRLASGKVGRNITLCQSLAVNPDKVERIRTCLRTLYGGAVTNLKGGLKQGLWKEDRHINGKMAVFRLNRTASLPLLAVAPEKKAKPEFVCALTRAQLKLFLDTCVEADGHVHSMHGQRLFIQKDIDRLTPVQMAATLLGVPTNIKAYPSGMHNMFIGERKVATLITLHQSQRLVRYTGEVWCPRVKNGTWLARREGSIYFTGNTMDTGTWERAKDFDSINDIRQGTRIYVFGGSTQSGTYLVTSSVDPSTFVIDTTSITIASVGTFDQQTSSLGVSSGGNISFNSGDVTITHAVNTLAFAGASSGYSFDALITGSSNVVVNGTLAVSSGTSSVIVSGSTVKVAFDGTNNARVQTNATDATVGFSAARFSNDTSPARLTLLKSRNTTVGSHTVVQDGDTIGEIRASASDGTIFSQAALVLFKVAGTPGSSDMPGRVIVQTSSDGSATPSDRLNIDSTGVNVTGSMTISSAAAVTGTLTSSGLITGNAGVSVNSSFTSSGNINAVSGTSITLGGVAGKAIMLFGSTAFGIYAGSSAPAIAAGRGSIYLRDDGASSLTRAYIQSSGSTNTWVGLLTTA